MKITFNKKQFEEMFAYVADICSKNGTVPIVENVYVEIDKQVTFMSTNLETSIILTTDYDKEKNDIKEKIRFLIRPNELLQILKLTDVEEIILELGDDNRLTIYMGLDIMDISIYTDKNAVDAFPAIPKLKNSTSLVLPLDDFKKALYDVKIVQKTGNTDHMREFYDYIMIDKDDDGWSFASTDAFMLVKTKIKDYSKEFEESEFQTQFPYKTIPFIEKLKGNVSIILSSSDKHNKITYSQDKIDITMVTVKGVDNYPNYRAVIPSDYTGVMKINKTAFLKAIKKAGLINEVIKIDIDDKLIISSENVELARKMKSVLDEEYEHNQKIVVGANKKLLLLIVQAYKEDVLTMKYNKPNKALVFEEEDGNTLFLLMPVMLQNNNDESDE